MIRIAVEVFSARLMDWLGLEYVALAGPVQETVQVLAEIFVFAIPLPDSASRESALNPIFEYESSTMSRV